MLEIEVELDRQDQKTTTLSVYYLFKTRKIIGPLKDCIAEWDNDNKWGNGEKSSRGDHRVESNMNLSGYSKKFRAEQLEKRRPISWTF